MRPALGDSIGEYRILKMLNQNYDVYYNGVPFEENADLIGRSDKIIIPKSGYDLYYVRCNKNIFLELPHPKVYMAYPYDEDAFKVADGLVVTTDYWKKYLTDPEIRRKENDITKKWYLCATVFPKKVIQFKQCCDPLISSENIKRSFYNKWRSTLTNTLSFGFYGRLDIETIPTILATEILRKQKQSKELSPVLAFAGKILRRLQQEGGLPRNSLFLGEIPYHEMPSLIAATDYTLAVPNHTDAKFLGSNKILDSLNVGTPVLSFRNEVRKEYLGDNYPGLFDDLAEFESLLERIICKDNNLISLLKNETSRAAKENNIINAANFTGNEINEFLDSWDS